MSQGLSTSLKPEPEFDLFLALQRDAAYLKAPPNFSLESIKQVIPSAEPKFDLNAYAQKLPPAREHIQKAEKRSLYLSIVLHLVFLVTTYISLEYSGFKLVSNEEIQPIEIVFGLTPDLKSMSKKVEAPEKETPKQATRVAEQLPQLPKVVTVEQTNGIDAEETLVEQVPEAAETAAKQQEKVQPAKQQKPIAGAKVLSVEELLKLAEKESRAVGKKTSEGSKDGLQTGGGTQSNATVDSKNDAAQESAVPVGSLEGKVLGGAKDAYSAAALNHIKRIWRLPNTVQFDPNLEVIVQFDVNTFGKVIGTAQIEQSSGNPEFDEQALEVVRNGDPYPELPKELTPRMRIRVKLKPQDARK